MGEHARFSPSSADRWMTCTGSILMEEMFPEETSEFASEGTAMHTVREMALRSGQDVEAYIGQVIEEDGRQYEVTREWADWLQPGIDFIREQAIGGEMFVEERVLLDVWVPEQFGTVDTLVVRDDLIVVQDFKGGRGVVVDAEHNKQMMLYALGAWENIARHKTKATDFLLVIDQPRVPGKGSEWRTTLKELLLFAEEASAATTKALSDEAELVPSIEACRFCRAASNSACYALDQFILDLLGLTLEDLDKDRSQEPAMIEYDKLAPERRSYIVEHMGMIRSWLSKLHENALADTLQGEPIPGFKAVSTLGDREWIDPEAAETYFKGRVPDKDMYVRKLKSPAQMEKVVGTRVWRKAEAELIHRPDGKPALVPEKDPRPALVPLVNLLDDLDDDPQDELLADLDDLLGETEETDDFVDDLI